MYGWKEREEDTVLSNQDDSTCNMMDNACILAFYHDLVFAQIISTRIQQLNDRIQLSAQNSVFVAQLSSEQEFSFQPGIQFSVPEFSVQCQKTFAGATKRNSIFSTRIQRSVPESWHNGTRADTFIHV